MGLGVIVSVNDFDIVAVGVALFGGFILVENQLDRTKEGVAEAVVVEHVEVEFRRGVVGGAHLGGGEVLGDVHVAVARDGGAAVPVAVVLVWLGGHQTAVGVFGEVFARHHHQAEVGVRVVVDVVDAQRGGTTFGGEQLKVAVGGGLQYTAIRAG